MSVSGAVIPQVKVEHAPDVNVKQEQEDVDMPSPAYADDDLDGFEDTGDLDFSQANQTLWLSHIPRTLWESLSKLQDNDEVDLGTIRVEGPEDNPTRVLLKLNNLSQLEDQHKEYDLQRPPKEKVRSHREGQSLVFSEKDLPGFKSRSFVWDQDDDETGQGRSKLYDDAKRSRKRKERKEKQEPFVPYRRAIPKRTAMAGTVTKEFDAQAVKNAEYDRIERLKLTRLLAAPKPSDATTILAPHEDPTRRQNVTTMRQRQQENKAAAARRQAVKDSRTSRMESKDLVRLLLEHFKQHRIWGLRDLKASLQQPESFIRETLQDIAFMHKHGDFNGKWELKEEYKAQDAALLNPQGLEAPKQEDSEMDVSGIDEDDDDEDEKFEDV